MLDNCPARVCVEILDVDAIENRLVVADSQNDRSRHAHVFATLTDLRMVGVVHMVGGVAIVLHDEARLSLVEEELDPLPLILGIAVTAQLKIRQGRADASLGKPLAGRAGDLEGNPRRRHREPRGVRVRMRAREECQRPSPRVRSFRASLMDAPCRVGSVAASGQNTLGRFSLTLRTFVSVPASRTGVL